MGCGYYSKNNYMSHRFDRRIKWSSLEVWVISAARAGRLPLENAATNMTWVRSLPLTQWPVALGSEYHSTNRTTVAPHLHFRGHSKWRGQHSTGVHYTLCGLESQCDRRRWASLSFLKFLWLALGWKRKYPIFPMLPHSVINQSP